MAETSAANGRTSFTWGHKFSSSAGSDLKFSAGNSSSVSMSADSKLSAGVSWSIGLGTSAGLTLYDSKFSTHLAGASSGIEEAYQKSYKDTFSISVGSFDRTLYWKLKLFTGLAVTPQIGVVASLGATTAPLTYDINDSEAKRLAGQWWVQAGMYAGAVSALGAALAACYLNFKKFSKKRERIDKSKATISVSKNSRAFIGVQGGSKASGLQFQDGSFKLLSMGGENVSFNRVGYEDPTAEKFLDRHGWEVVGLTDSHKAATEISGNNKKLKLKSSRIFFSAGEKTKISKITVGPFDSGHHGVKIEASGNKSRISLSSNQEILLAAGKSPTKGRLMLSDKSAKLQTGAAEISIDNKKFLISGYLQNQKIEVSKNGIIVGHGGNVMKIHTAGVDLCGGALKIFNGTVAIPAIEAEMAAQKKALEEEVSVRVELAELELNERIEQAETKLNDIINKITSEAEAALRE